MVDAPGQIANLGYLVAGIGFLLLLGLLLTALRGRSHIALLRISTTATVIWAAVLAMHETVFIGSNLLLFLGEFVRDLVWIIFLAGILRGATGRSGHGLVLFAGPALIAAIILYGCFAEFLLFKGISAGISNSVLVLGKIVSALAALVYLEQIIRNSRDTQRRGLKFMCVGVGIIFAYDLLLFSNAALSGGIHGFLGGARGYVVALSVPFIALAVKRSPTWAGGIFLSRQIVFYTSTLFAAGLYLVLGGLVGQYLRTAGGSWGGVAQVVFVTAAVAGLLALLISRRIRSRIRVFIDKHFFQDKYDYRQEWLRLIDTLTSETNDIPLKKRAIKAVADVLQCDRGVLWMHVPSESEFQVVAAWNTGESSGRFSDDHSLVRFMSATGWVIEIDEFRADPDKYVGLDLEPAELGVDNPGIVVPLPGNGTLTGFVALAHPESGVSLNYEDRDLLKTAGRQIASYLLQESAVELLSQNRQFEAFNKLTAYLMHDLKNVLAQQSLLVENAAIHRSKPEFVDDAISTIDSSVHRLRRVIEQLQQGSRRVVSERVELGETVTRAVSQCADRVPRPDFSPGNDRVWVRADREQLQMAIVHAIRNAQDACEPDGNIGIRISADAEFCELQISDDGSGMDEVFIRERLFKPFDSTKGTQGMGIGAYQIRESLNSIGGTLAVDSEPGIGTTMTFKVPSARAPMESR